MSVHHANSGKNTLKKNRIQIITNYRIDFVIGTFAA